MVDENSQTSRAQIDARVGFESARRLRIGVPAVAGGVLYLLSGIIANSTLSNAPTVGVLQGLAPAFRGEPNPAESPRAPELKYQSHHAFGLIAGSVMSSLAIAALIVILLFLLDAARFRRPETNRVGRPIVLVGGILLALLSVVNEIVLAVKAHNFATGHDFSTHAAEAVTHGTGYDVLAIVAPLSAIALAAGMVITMLATFRVGLIPRWMAIVGGVSAILLLLPVATLDIIPAFWMVVAGILLMGKFPNGDPPAWGAGEARPWPSPADMRAAKAEAKAGNSPSKGRPALSGAGTDVAIETDGSRTATKRRRKRGSRR